ncbi:ureidoglycolate lyase [Methylovirgula sp. 4M-Z18]|uniref:ureidoglycolate lyase n=1 Tax=Methylovirgula sp. 4M-Z18 TaxID=2293567 RepID=UPI000E2F806F|nr:ureidoglycolate lyase [Methylovirgula sp. 4M-Z18]RFB80909.1 ureidoglycolate lyase [Methylovirgula sp. 4M-Z18]
MRELIVRPLTRAAFAAFGEVIETDGARHYPINNGRTERYHALARSEAVGPGGHVIINIFKGTPYALPLKLEMVERHPLGSQAFFPLSAQPFLVVVAPDAGGRPGEPQVFLTQPWQGVNYPRNLWHGVLTPLSAPQDFLVVDRAGEGNNLEEFFFPEPYLIRLP